MHSIHNNLLSLREFTEVHDIINPWHFAQLTSVPLRTAIVSQMLAKCSDVVYERKYKDISRISRRMVASAIRRAEEKFSSFTGYFPAPKFIENEELLMRFPRWTGSDCIVGVGYTRFGYITDIGTEVLTQLGTAPIVISNEIPDIDSFDETATITFVAAGQNGITVDEVAVFFQATDYTGDMEDWEIRPLHISINHADPDNPVLTITGPLYMFVRPFLYLETAPLELDATDTLNYIGSVEIHRRTVDTTDVGTITHAASCVLSTSTPCFTIVDHKAGLVRVEIDQLATPPASVCTCQYSEEALTVRINYRSGWPRQGNGWMDHAHADMLAILAASLMECLPCGCACGDNDAALHHWAHVPSITSPAGNTTIMSHPDFVKSKFGFSEGGVYAFHFADDPRRKVTRV